MKSRIITSLCAFVLAFAVTTAFSAEKLKPMAGTQSLNFTFGGFANMNLIGAASATPIAGVNVVGAGYRYYLNDQWALRTGVGFSSTSDKSDDSSGIDHSSTGVSVLAGIEYHLIENGPLAPYWAGFVNYAKGSKKTERKSGGSKGTTTNSGSAFGVAVAMGIEWFIADHVSLNGEYQLGFASGRTETEVVNSSTTTKTDGPTSTVIGTDMTAQFGLNFYF